jgi:rare lipoprotein A
MQEAKLGLTMQRPPTTAFAPACQRACAAASVAVALWLVGCASVPPSTGPGPAAPTARSPSGPGAPTAKTPHTQATEATPPTDRTSAANHPAPAIDAPNAVTSEPTAAERAEATGWQEKGIASWYGPRFQGKRTASGERFDTNELTAAHKTLPFGTRVRVKSLVNGKEVVVRINDRGPFIKGRIIDLSRAAAEALGLSGIKQVVLERLR